MKKSLLVGVLSLTLAACSIKSNNVSSVEQWTNYDNQATDSSSLSSEKALVVFYRTSDFVGDAVNIYISGSYQASLLESSYTAVPICANTQILSSSFVTNQHFSNRKQGVTHSFPSQSETYMKVSLNPQGEPTFIQVDEQIAKQEIKDLKGIAKHTLSRVSSSCSSTQAISEVTNAANVIFTEELAAWDVNKFSHKDMNAKSKANLKQIAGKIKAAGLDNIAYVEARGYTDPNGTERYNLSLSQKRADSVAPALASLGVKVPVNTVGLGKSNLVVKNCMKLHPKDEKARRLCDQPNRRVEISVIGK